MIKRVQVSLDEDLSKAINKLKGFGTKDAERIKSIVRAYLAEKGKIG